MNATYEGICGICDRFATTLSEHHLIPRTTHSNGRVRKMFSREEMTSRTVDSCQPCHKAIHSFWTEKELALEHNTVADLKAQPEMQKHIAWVRKQQPGFRSKGKRMNQKEKQW